MVYRIKLKTKNTNMITPLRPPFTLTEEEKEFMFWNQWRFDSHNWIEYSEGYYKCKFCELTHTSTLPIGSNMPLCNKNPYIKDIVKSIVDTINENY
jgi:hypothetical protein